MPPPTLDQVIFPEQANQNFSRILGDLKRSNFITNRLASISHDAAFVEKVADALKLPLVSNERCGSWYIDPARKAGSAYFKSTDGHTGQWKFSSRRLNLHLLELIGENDGCIIVDSTRRGKRMPDALSKTLPTWCAVLNRALFPTHDAPNNNPNNNSSNNPSTNPSTNPIHALYTPPNTVSPSEASQITSLLPQFLTTFHSLALNPTPLLTALHHKPLHPLFITPEDDVTTTAAALTHLRRSGYSPIVCCTASRRAAPGEVSEVGGGGYVQGAGDDTENWACGLTPGVFWRWRGVLLGAGEGELPGLIRGLVEREGKEVEREGRGGGGVREVVKGRGVFVGGVLSKRCLEVGLGKSKAASRLLRDALPQICEFVLAYLRRPATGEAGAAEKKVVVLCETGKDLSVGVALAVYCWCFDDAGNVRQDDKEVSFNKAAIRVRLGHIVTTLPEANPSRATLQSVNSFLMDWRK
ncbi:tRNA A64-2'-O-ribosylphosphate transferase [Chaetomium fimeti]|uniref:tRNA A64-2'-O-ribosylphosphate transferase n=1 Tax=Chaetomium fimeti TaxID=1854472 RepID=A0AAE0HP70_9PEZI|nr:tRNA A64-2'-O-ribosylphosphate transferase [Chaetomium fimeti]